MEVAPASAVEFRQVTVGGAHTCALTTEGQAFCWGLGGLGNGSTLDIEATPTPVAGGRTFRQLSAGSGHTCGVTVNDRLFCWGLNHLGQLGDGTGTDRSRPVQIARGTAFRQVSAGSIHTCAVTTDHVAYCWGHSQAGTLGDGNRGGSSLPVRVARGLAFREVSAGDQFTCGLTTDDVAFCWGLNNQGQLGLGTDAGPELCFTGDGDNACSKKPARVRGGLIFSRLGTGGSHTCGLTRDGSAYCWGASFAGQLGGGTSTRDELKPAKVLGDLVFGSLSVGGLHSCGATTDRAAWCWGDNFFGELGTDPDSGPELCPELGTPCATRPVQVVSELVFREVVVGSGSHTCGLTMARRIYCWGANLEGQLGDGTTRSSPRPRRVVF